VKGGGLLPSAGNDTYWEREKAAPIGNLREKRKKMPSEILGEKNDCELLLKRGTI